jgi:hypothetical protein
MSYGIMSVDDKILEWMLKQEDSVIDPLMSLPFVYNRFAQRKKYDSDEAKEEKEYWQKDTLYNIIKAYLDRAGQTFKADVMKTIMKSDKINAALKKISNAAAGYQNKKSKVFKSAKERDYQFSNWVRVILEAYFEIVSAKPVAAGGEGGMPQDTESEKEDGEGGMPQDTESEEEDGEAGNEDQGQAPDGKGVVQDSEPDDDGVDATNDALNGAGEGGAVIVDLTKQEEEEELPVVPPARAPARAPARNSVIVDLSLDDD